MFLTHLRIRDMSKQKKNNKQQTPDDYFSHGCFEMARFGKSIVMRNNMTDDQFEQIHKHLAERYPDTIKEIDATIANIVNEVQKYQPNVLLYRAYWASASSLIGIGSESEMDKDGAIAQRALEYIQNIIASVEPNKNAYTDLEDEDWDRILLLIEELYTKVNFEYQICRRAWERGNNPEYNDDIQDYLFKAQLYWCNVRGKRYLCHEESHFRELLSPHSDVLEELFGISSDQLIAETMKIQHSLTHGLGETMLDIHAFNKSAADAFAKEGIDPDKLPKAEAQSIVKNVLDKHGLEEKRNDIGNRFLGFDLFDIQKVTELPEPFLKELSWAQGEDSEFFSNGNFKGWPLRIQPVTKRPFIYLDESYYCFNLYSLLDNLYRIIERTICRLKPSYRQQWCKKQKVVSEQLPLEHLKRLLPNAETYESVYYRWQPADAKKSNWHETDGILIYDDCLFVIEVKAGAFTYTSPANDFQAYIKSIEDLLFKPASQGQRFVDYLKSDSTVSICDSKHKEIRKLSQKDFENIIIVTVSLDDFTEIASQAQHLNAIGMPIGDYNIWSVSIDDLRSIADIFDDPLIFLHFLEQRMDAFGSKEIKTEDELDHVGLYLEFNAYKEHAKEFDADLPVNWHGFREKIDHYFTDKLHNPSLESPLKQEMPNRLKEIINTLSGSNKTGCRRVACHLLNFSGEWRNNIASTINNTLSTQRSSKTAKHASMQGKGYAIGIFCWQHGVVSYDRQLSLEMTWVAMLATNDIERLLLNLHYNASGQLIDVDFEYYSQDDIPKEQIEDLRQKAGILKTDRINRAKQTSGEIGRNDPCPCGSGLKYKKCCGR